MDVFSVIETVASLSLTVGVFAGAVWLNKKTKSPPLNPLLV